MEETKAILSRLDGIETGYRQANETLERIENELKHLAKFVSIRATKKTSPLSELANEITSPDKITVNGIDFNIRIEAQRVSGNVYKRYYAKKVIAGKLYKIYLGEKFSQEQATQKIKAYCEKYLPKENIPLDKV